MVHFKTYAKFEVNQPTLSTVIIHTKQTDRWTWLELPKTLNPFYPMICVAFDQSFVTTDTYLPL